MLRLIYTSCLIIASLGSAFGGCPPSQNLDACKASCDRAETEARIAKAPDLFDQQLERQYSRCLEECKNTCSPENQKNESN